MEKLSQILMRERELLDTLLFKLETEQLMLASGRSRWLLRIARELENVLSTLRETEILRSVAADQVADSLGIGSNPSLRALAGAVEEPWRTILAEHHEAFGSVTRAISTLAEANRDLIAAGSTARVKVGGHLALAGTGNRAFDHRAGRTTVPRSVDRSGSRSVAAQQMQQAAYQASLAVTARVMQPSLIDFLT